MHSSGSWTEIVHRDFLTKSAVCTKLLGHTTVSKGALVTHSVKNTGFDSLPHYLAFFIQP